MSIKSYKLFSKKHSHRWAAVGSDVEAQRLVNEIPLRADLSDPKYPREGQKIVEILCMSSVHIISVKSINFP